MKSFLILAICLFGLTVAYETYLGNSRHPDHPGKCYHNATEHLFDVNDVYKPTGKEYCEKFTCMDDYVIRVNACQKYSVPAECTGHKGDNSLPFPDCCAYLTCIDDNGQEIIRKTGSE